MADENEVLEVWEELNDNEVMDKKLQNFKIPNDKDNSSVVLKEESTRTQYSQVRILKRQSDTNGIPKVNVSKSQGASQKSFQQREAEYMEARMRILGEDYSGADNCNNSVTTVGENIPVKLVKQVDEVKLQSGKVQLLREPKGPDGSGGFDQGR